MNLKAVPSLVDCSHPFFHAFVPSVPASPFTSSSCLRKYETARTFSLVLSNPFVSKTLLKSPNLYKISRGLNIRPSCSSNLDGVEESSFHLEGLAKGAGGVEGEGSKGLSNRNVHGAISKKIPFTGKHGRDRDSFLHSQFDFLEPMMLGIRPDFPDWPDQETTVWATIEQKAKSFDIPLSLRMIKKKLQWEEGSADSKELEYCSVKAAFASMVFIIVELQSCALHMRETLCHEDLEIISSKVQKEMHSSFVWLFQQVFSRTPVLMLHMMILLANFSVYSASHNIAMAETLPSRTFIESTLHVLSTEDKQIQQYPQFNSSSPSLASKMGIGGNNVDEKAEVGDMPQSSHHSGVYLGNQLESLEEMDLWVSMVGDATKMQEDVGEEVLDHDAMQHFVSPVSVELEPDDYEDYLRTDLLYQMTLSQEPTNPLLLCNYAQFLHLVARDYDRAEECFKRAVQVLPPDAESLNQYANFLWTVRRDSCGAEERFLQALSVEPDNPYYASRYANFLWSTGGEETCFPLNKSQNPTL